MIIINVVRSPFKRSGYSLQHNQPVGFKGAIRSDKTFGWYKYKEDADKRAKELMKSYNQ
jgi:hypothetical protein